MADKNELEERNNLKDVVVNILLSDGWEDIRDELAEKSLEEVCAFIQTLDGVPLLKTVPKALRTIKNIHDWHETRKFMAFMQRFKLGNVDEQEIERRRVAYQKHERWFEREVEQNIIYLSRYADIKKVNIHAKLYIDLLNKRISEDDFSEYLDILDRLYLSDLPQLIEIHNAQMGCSEVNYDPAMFQNECGVSYDIVRCNRLEATGLLVRQDSFTFGKRLNKQYIITRRGHYFAELMLYDK